MDVDDNKYENFWYKGKMFFRKVKDTLYFIGTILSSIQFDN